MLITFIAQYTEYKNDFRHKREQGGRGAGSDQAKHRKWKKKVGNLLFKKMGVNKIVVHKFCLDKRII